MMTTDLKKQYDNPEFVAKYFKQIRSNRTVYKDIQRIVTEYFDNKKLNIFEIGFGPGIETEYLAKLGHRIEAIDASEPMRLLLTDHLSNILSDEQLGNVNLSTAKVEHYSVEANRYDFIFSSAVFHFLDKEIVTEVLASYVRGLKAGGVLYLSFKSCSGIRLEKLAGLTMAQKWESTDSQGRSEVTWLNYIYQRSE